MATQPPGAAALAQFLFDHAAQPWLAEGLAVDADWAAAQKAAQARFAAPAWTANVATLRPALVRGQVSFLSRLFGGYRRASAELASLLTGALPKSPADRLALVDELAEVQARRARLAEEEGWLQSAYGPEWRGERTPFADMQAAARWLAEVRRAGTFANAAQLAAALGAVPDPGKDAAALMARVSACRERIAAPVARLRLDLPQAGLLADIDTSLLAELRAAFAQMADDPSRYGDWSGLARSIGAAEAAGAGSIVDGDEGEPHSALRAKKAAAFFRISRSAQRRATSFFSAAISARSARICPFPGNAVADFTVSSRIQRLRTLSATSRSRAA